MKKNHEGHTSLSLVIIRYSTLSFLYIMPHKAANFLGGTEKRRNSSPNERLMALKLKLLIK